MLPLPTMSYDEGMHYQLWDVESGNLLDDFETLDAAVVVVRQLLALNGDEAVDDAALVRVNDDGQTVRVGAGRALVSLTSDEASGHEAQRA